MFIFVHADAAFDEYFDVNKIYKAHFLFIIY